MGETVGITYGGSTPGADANDYVLFDTTVAAPMRGFFQLAGIKRFVISIAHSHAGTLKAYWSSDGGTNWRLYHTQAVAAPAAGDTTDRDYFVGNYRDWKLVWTNGGSAQNPWAVLLSGDTERSVAA